MTRDIPSFLVGFMLAGLMGCAELPPTPDPVLESAVNLPCFQPRVDFQWEIPDCAKVNSVLSDLLTQHEMAEQSDWQAKQKRLVRLSREDHVYDSAQWKYLVRALYIGQTCQRAVGRDRAKELRRAFLLALHKLDVRPPRYNCDDAKKTLHNYDSFVITLPR